VVLSSPPTVAGQQKSAKLVMKAVMHKMTSRKEPWVVTRVLKGLGRIVVPLWA